MKGRGLAVADEGLAIARLRDLNYYRLRGYWLTLARDGSFIEGASFDDIWEIYQLDRGLRTWLWRAIAPVEIKLRYGKLPVWAAVECMSLGTLSMLYGNLDPDTGTSDSSRGVQAEVAEAFGTKPYYLRSWMHHLTTVRNIATHHDRFYNRVMTIRPALLKRDEKCVRRRDMSKQFPTFLVMRRIYEKSWPEEWESLLDELASCIEQHPSVSLIPMGFPKDWMSRMGAATSRAIIPRT